MIDYFRDLEYPALGYVFSVAAINATNSSAAKTGAAILRSCHDGRSQMQIFNPLVE